MLFWDTTGKGDYQATIAIRTTKAVVLYPYEVSIDVQKKKTSMTRGTAKKSVLSVETQLTVFDTTI